VDGGSARQSDSQSVKPFKTLKNGLKGKYRSKPSKPSKVGSRATAEKKESFKGRRPHGSRSEGCKCVVRQKGSQGRASQGVCVGCDHIIGTRPKFHPNFEVKPNDK
jgi:hypothetical protein